ncbi:uncharacterized protein LOC100279051 [Zea mays]|uniref:Uncharacterized protein n=1 Tax=Zea mays TaxID=4577 RepID=B6UH53_MAIZE|nr:uncharacterized protein LOC100279051 [Zea mays]ACG48686.1 hypothetical protein [Zea mays]AQK93592.1 hypothetical protein ZEAMMB73_Zm00001d010185 [Zea mays]|eukprot:NP_001145580.1 uncharacterized protein LOC100279051 [Zea mays]
MQTAVAVLLSGVVALFGVTSAVLAFIAEAKRLTADEIRVSGRECVYPANAAHTLGICAIFLLAAAQIIASVAGGCCGCCRPPGGGGPSPSPSSTRRRVVGVIASVLSWVAAAIAVVYDWVGAALNAPVTREARLAGSDEECYLLRGGIFVRAAVLSLVATSLGIMSCILLRLPPPATHAPEQGHRAVGLPQWPAQETYPYPAHGYAHASDPKFAPPAPHGQANEQVYV